MSETIVTRYRLEVDDLVAEANKASNAVKGVGDDAAKSGKEASKSLKEVSAALKDNEQASKRLSKEIREQERAANKAAKEINAINKQLKGSGTIGAAEFNKIQDKLKSLNKTLDQSKSNIKGLKIDKSIVDGNVRDLKKQESQLKKNQKEMRQAGKETSGFEKALKRIGPAIVAAFTFEAARRLFTEVNRLAAQFQQFDRKAAIVFGDSLDSVTEAAERNAIAIGLTRTEYISAAAGIQDILVPLGFARGQASELATETTNLAGAISAWSGGQYDAATSAQILQKALTGEVEQLKSVGIVIDQSSKQFNERIKLLMETEGLTLQQAKALDILNQISEKSVDAQANLGEATEDVAVQQAKANAEFRESREILVRDLTPAVIAVTGFFTQLADKIGGIVENISTTINRGFEYQGVVAAITREQNKLNKAVEEGDREQEKALTRKIEELKQEKMLLDFEYLSLEAKDDAIAKETLSNEFVDKRIKQLESQILLYKKEQTNLSEIETLEQRIAFLKGEQVEDEKNLNDEKNSGVKLTKDQIEAQRALRADQIALRVAEQERNNAIINDNLEAEKAALEEANRLAEESGNQNIRQRLANSKRIEEINRELLQSDLRLATVREDAKRAEIALLNSIENKTPAIQAQIFGAEEDLVRLSRAVDDILLKLATGGGESFTRELAPDIDFSEGIGDMPIEQVEEALLGMYGRLQVSYEDLAKRTREIQQENLHLMLTDQEAWEMAVKESTGRVAEYRSQAALSYLNAITGVFNQVLQMEKQQGANSRELTLFTIGLNTATAIAGAVASAANIQFPANIPAIAAAISAALSGIAQARQALEPAPSLRSFEGGGATSPTSRTGGVDGKGGFNAILHPKEYVIDSLNPEKGLKDMFADKKLAGIISRWSFKDRLDVASSSHTTINNTKSSNWSDSRMVRELKNSVELQALAVQEMRKLGKSNRFKRAGAG